MSQGLSVQRARSPSATAGPGPKTLATFANANVVQARNAGRTEGREERTRLGELDADGEDDPDAMEGVEEVVRDYVDSGTQSAVTQKVPTRTQEAVPNPTFSAKVTGQQAPSKSHKAALSAKAKEKQPA